MNITEAVKIVSDAFIEEMKENGFGAFSEMVKCYKMSRDDLLDEIRVILSDYVGAWVDEENGDICAGNEIDYDTCAYKDFLKMVKAKTMIGTKGDIM